MNHDFPCVVPADITEQHGGVVAVNAATVTEIVLKLATCAISWL